MDSSLNEKDLAGILASITDLEYIAKNCPERFIRQTKLFMKQLDEREFRIAVVGEFSAGKSTFLNALIGRDVLLHGLTETTATITYIHCVPENHTKINKAVVRYCDDNRGDKEYSIGSNWEILKDYTTTTSLEHDVTKEIDSVDIYVHIKNIQDNVVFVDTPGLNGVADGHRDLTLKEIKNAHACLCLFQLRGLSESETEFIKLLSQYQNTLIFVMNFIDQINVSEGETYESQLQMFKSGLEKQLVNAENSRIKEINAFGVSALNALAYKDESIKRLYRDDIFDLTPKDRKRLWEESKFYILEDYLWDKILHGEKSNIFINAMLQNIKNLINELTDEIGVKLAIQNSGVTSRDYEEINYRIERCGKTAGKNWEKVYSFIQSERYDILKEVTVKLKDEVKIIQETLQNEINSEDFDSMESALKIDKYGKLLENLLLKLRHNCLDWLALIFERCYQEAVLAAKKYSGSVQIDEVGKIKFINETEEDFGRQSFEAKLNQLQDKKASYEREIKNISDSSEHIRKKQNKIEDSIRDQKDFIKESEKQLKRDKDRLGSEPSSKYVSYMADVQVERAKYSPLRLFSGSTKTVKQERTYEDTSEKDEWKKKVKKLNKQYADTQDTLNRQLQELKSKRKELEGELEINAVKASNISKRIEDLSLAIKREEREFEEIISKAKAEYLKVTKSRLSDKIAILLDSNAGEVYFKLHDSIRKNIEANFRLITEKTKEYYNIFHEENLKRLNSLKFMHAEHVNEQEREKDVREATEAMERLNSLKEKLNQ